MASDQQQITADMLQEIIDDLDAEAICDTPKNTTENLNIDEKQLKEEKSRNVMSLHLPKTDPENTEHMRIYKKYMYYFATLAKAFGVKVNYDWIPQHYFLTWLTSFFVSLAASLILYTIYHHYYYGDYRRILEPLAIAGITISCVLKWLSHLTHFPKMFSLLFYTRKLCLENVTGKRADILTCGLRNTYTVCKIFALGISALLVCYVAVPAKFYLFDNILIPLMPVEFPFKQSTISGMILSLFIQVIIGTYGFMATLSFGLGFVICICNYDFIVDLIDEDFTDLDQMWNGSSTTSVSFRHAYLRNICQKLQDMKRYLDTTKQIYKRKFFFYFIVNFLGQIICLFEIKDNDWIPGYTVALVLFTEMMFYCVVGTRIEIAGDKLCSIIYCSNWYKYDLESQRILQLLLHECQQPKQLELGHLGPLNVVTLIQIVKGIYSYYTVMLDVL